MRLGHLDLANHGGSEGKSEMVAVVSQAIKLAVPVRRNFAEIAGEAIFVPVPTSDLKLVTFRLVLFIGKIVHDCQSFES